MMIRKNSILQFILLCFSILILQSCKKKDLEAENAFKIDYGENYYGTYTGIQIYEDQQQMTSDTTVEQIILSRFENDTIVLVEVNLPATTNKYYFEAKSTGLIHYGSCYHCPSILISEDSLTGSWNPSLAPRAYKYLMVKD